MDWEGFELTFRITSRSSCAKLHIACDARGYRSFSKSWRHTAMETARASFISDPRILCLTAAEHHAALASHGLKTSDVRASLVNVTGEKCED